MMIFDVPVIGILRNVEAMFFREVVHASFESGLQAIEVTINTENACEIVSDLRDTIPEGKLLGMGTVRDVKEAEAAVGAGAMFLVTPNVDSEVIALARSKNIPVIAGGFTPTEVYRAWSLGADMVKVFPAGQFGPSYIKDLLGPFDKVPLVAVGGVTTSNVKDYFEAGAKAVGVSSALFGTQALKDKNIDKLAVNVKKFIGSCREC